MTTNQLIALWCHPRSMSTAMERVMHGRGDCTCLHEPFMYDYYCHRGVSEMPHFNPDPERPKDYRSICDHLIGKANERPVFFKDMSYYVVPRIFQDEAFSNRLHNVFLIRDPRRSLASYHKLDAAFSSEEAGIEAIWRHVDWLVNHVETRPLILRAETISQNPEREIRRLTDYCGLPPMDGLHEWGSGTPAQWQEVAAWHGAVMQSTGIHADEDMDAQEIFESAANERPELRAILDHHLPFYNRLVEMSR